LREPSDEERAQIPPFPPTIGSQADFEQAWRCYVWLEAVQWRHLPDDGGLLDQDETLMENIFMIASAVGRAKKTNA
jgi:hypothetical protein